jgi:aspartate aminotransferase
MLKDLVKNLKPSSTLLINETSRKLEEQGKKIFIHLDLNLKV